MKIQQLPELIQKRFNANYQVLYFEGDEFHRYLEAIQSAAKTLKEEYIADGDKDVEIDVICHDKFCGFYRGQPGISEPGDKTNKPLNALPVMMASDQDLAKLNNNMLKLFNPQHHVIFVLKDWEVDLNTPPDGPKVVQFIRNIVHSNMCASNYYGEERKAGIRGQRMLVFVSATSKLPPTLPELHPIQIPLPDDEVLGNVVKRVLDPIEDAHTKTKGKKGFVTPQDKRIVIVRSLNGLTDQAAEDALSLAVSQHKGTADLQKVLETIEDEKSTHVAGVPGLEYISRELVADIELPGYEKAVEFIEGRQKLSPDKAKKHKIKALNGLTLVGPPGTGKTMFGFLMSKLTGRILLKWSLGESKGGIVGQSEANTRRAIQIAQAMQACVLLDDIDKGSIGASSGGHSSDGGTTGNMIQMLLTEMSRPDNRAVWVFTLNRIQMVPPELIRPGRMDAVFYLQRPDEGTRAEIFRSHLTRRNFTPSDEHIERLVPLTQDWVGAEIEALIKNVQVPSLTKGDDMDYELLISEAKNYTPMTQQDAFRDDLALMDKFSQQFIKIGRVESAQQSGAAASGRARRSLR
jgi:ATP-dependent 26S proteasome regulatory subunit